MACGLKLGKGVSKELVKFITVLEPLTVKGTEENLERRDTFELAEPSPPGVAFLPGVKKLILKLLLEKYPDNMSSIKKQASTPGRDIFEAYMPSYDAAFKVAEAWGEGVSGGGVTLNNFRILIVLLCIHAAMYDAFFLVTDDDSPEATMGVEEWIKGYKNLAQYGFVGFSDLKDMKGSRASLGAFFFTELDSSKDKRVEIAEWFSFIQKKVRILSEK